MLGKYQEYIRKGKETMDEGHLLNCANCTVGNCSKLTKSFPDFCLTTNTPPETVEKVVKRYIRSPMNRRMSLTSADIESRYYGKATRVEETLIFIKDMGYKKVGVATCLGLLNECNLFARVARAKGIELYGVARKVGARWKRTRTP